MPPLRCSQREFVGSDSCFFPAGIATLVSQNTPRTRIHVVASVEEQVRRNTAKGEACFGSLRLNLDRKCYETLASSFVLRGFRVELLRDVTL